MKNLKFRPTLADRLTLRHFRSAIDPKYQKAFDHDLQVLISLEHKNISDQTAQGHIIFVASVLTFYNVLIKSDYSKENALQQVNHIVMTCGNRTIKFLMKLSFLFSSNPMKTLKWFSGQDVIARRYGPLFEIEYKSKENGFTHQVTRCAYLDFLRRHDGIHLISSICEWDKIWINALPDAIKFSRPETLAYGAKCCRFEFTKET